MFRKSVMVAVVAAASAALPAGAQTSNPAYDQSPVLLLESGPSDAPGYRRKVLVHYLAGPSVRTSYAAFNRSEFVQAPGTADAESVRRCASGPATTLAEIDSFQRAQARREQLGQGPEVVRFCIKGVRGWKAGAQKRWLDPIFDGMPHAAALKNAG